MWKKKGRSSSILPRLSLGCARAPLNSTMVTKTWRFKRNSAQNVLYPVTYSQANPLHVTLIHFYSPINLNQEHLQTFDCTYLKKKGNNNNNNKKIFNSISQESPVLDFKIRPRYRHHCHMVDVLPKRQQQRQQGKKKTLNLS